MLEHRVQFLDLVPQHFILLDQPAQVVLQVLELALSLLPESLGAYPVLEQSLLILRDFLGVALQVAVAVLVVVRELAGVRISVTTCILASFWVIAEGGRWCFLFLFF